MSEQLLVIATALLLFIPLYASTVTVARRLSDDGQMATTY